MILDIIKCCNICRNLQYFSQYTAAVSTSSVFYFEKKMQGEMERRLSRANWHTVGMHAALSYIETWGIYNDTITIITSSLTIRWESFVILNFGYHSSLLSVNTGFRIRIGSLFSMEERRRTDKTTVLGKLHGKCSELSCQLFYIGMKFTTLKLSLEKWSKLSYEKNGKK